MHLAWSSTCQQVVAAYEFHPKRQKKKVKKYAKKCLICNTSVTLNEGQGHSNSYQTVECSGVYRHTTFERNRLANIRTQSNVVLCVCLFVSKRNHISRVLSLEYWLRETKLVWGLKDWQVLTVYQILLKSLENFVRWLAQLVLLSRTSAPLKQAQGRLGPKYTGIPGVNARGLWNQTAWSLQGPSTTRWSRTLKPCFTNPCATVDSRPSCAVYRVERGYSPSLCHCSSPFTWSSLQYPLFKLLQLLACMARDSTRFFMTRAMHGTWFSGLGLI